MYEIEDISLRHQEISADNYCSAVNGGASPTMDLYFSTSDSFSLQEMLDIDIKNEMDTDINFSFTDIPLLEHEEGSADFTWFSNNSNHSNSNLLEFGSDQVIMVNPNQVLKNPRSLQQKEDLSLNPQLPVPSPSPKQSHLTFSPAAIKLTNIKPDITAAKKDLTENLGTIKSINRACENIITPTIKASLSKPINIITAKTVITKPAQQSFLNNQSIRISTSKSFNSNVNITRVEALTPRHIISNNGISRKVNSKYRNEDENPFPKPTYSYSCLIAMALKNSRTGSLPVSEIYNFMCQHFPYFKTAPNGWKNSVRHNLSLNKCFEKIEKPATSGAQRKGCLWAMHPDKISKMDEEVQKWSRKDPAAIKRAMVYPENLEALERGELKYGSESYGDSCGSGGSDSEGETETEAEEYDGEVSQQEHNITINEDAVSQHDYVEIGSLADSYDEASLSDFDVGDHMYDEIEVVNDQEALRVEVALAQRELFKFEEARVSPSKRFRTSGSMNGETVHFASGGRRKTPLLVRNNSNTSFIEIGVTD